MHTLNEGKRSDRGRGMHKSANVLLLYYRVRKGLSRMKIVTLGAYRNPIPNHGGRRRSSRHDTAFSPK